MLSGEGSLQAHVRSVLRGRPLSREAVVAASGHGVVVADPASHRHEGNALVFTRSAATEDVCLAIESCGSALLLFVPTEADVVVYDAEVYGADGLQISLQVRERLWLEYERAAKRGRTQVAHMDGMMFFRTQF